MDDGHTEKGLTWRSVLRIVLKAALLFVLLNALFAAVFPMETLGSLSLYNRLFPGRPRLPYGENPTESYNLSLNNVPAMLASHEIVKPKTDDEFRVVVMGDSGIWGWLLNNEDTLAGQLNSAGYRTAGGRQVVVYNLGYPIMSLTKDLLLLDEIMDLDPDLVVWPVTLASFPREKQLLPPLVQHNAERIKPMIEANDLDLDGDDPQFIEPDFIGRTIVGQRRALADWLRLQLYGFSWAATGVDQAIPDEITPRRSDFEADLSWDEMAGPQTLTREELAFEVLAAGVARAADVPVWIVNEPIFISDGENSHLRYNAWYPRWAYDEYRKLLGQEAATGGWNYLDLWDAIDAAEFTDSPVHLTAEGTKELAERIGAAALESAGTSE